MQNAYYLEQAQAALDFGDKKYGPGSWKDVPMEKYLAALMRHVGAHMKGEVFDKESGIPHLGHAIANLIIIWRKS